MIIEFNHPDDEPPADSADDFDDESTESDATDANKGTLMLDATCAPQNIAFPQDITGYQPAERSQRESRNDY